MTDKLSPAERALWARVAAGVAPLDRGARARGQPRPQGPPPPAPPPPPQGAPPAGGWRETLDRRWDRALARGQAPVDAVVDLHGHTLEAAREALLVALDRSLGRGHRLMLVVTGRGDDPGPTPWDRMTGRGGRGMIAMQLPRWLAEPAIAARVAAFRRAHPRHGGAGAVYLVLRRPRAP